ncbi:choice-of-anchor D domain-containing protein [Bacteroidetes/Chlorobi group bacterium MS-B_bin-24]|nr:MAG: choice-of-anchor D domain-containing protein [Bacteroidetes/Chlorobi group bacterium MS-B_bin-24]
MTIRKIAATISLVFLLICNSLFSQPKISYLIPDVGAPGMGVYVEIIGPVNYFDNFGTDTIYYNNNGSVRIVFENPLDTEKVVVGPIAVFWQGRMISTYFFVNPLINEPNSSDWTALNPEFKIPFRVSVNGKLSNSDTFYIVKPYSFGNLLQNNFVFGTGALGRRSRSGAMIVDELNLRNGMDYKVFLDNSLAYPAVNRSYLPFVLLCQGNISGGSIARINVNGGDGRVQNAGPGGGGGGGKFCDFLTGNPGEDGGNGFTSGGFGGVNNLFGSGNYKQYGTGTGDSGKSLNGVLPALNPGAWEASGGGTGHPFGKSGIGCGDQSNWNVSGGYGGGTGSINNKMGGSGGFGTEGKSEPSNYINGGKVHGNEFIIPIAGGSGGASGNPSGLNVCSGSGGGGGGAIRIFAKRIENLAVLANGANGGSSGYGAGGGGSGGSISICAKELAANLNLSANGGNGGGNGYFRVDAPSFSNITYSHTNPAAFIGLSTDTNSITRRRKMTITGGKNPGSDSVLIFLKSQNSDWFLYKVVTGFKNQINFNFDLTFPDTSKVFYLCAIQDFNNAIIDTFKYKPRYLFSQSAMNIFVREKVGICVGDTLLNEQIKGCPGSVVIDTGTLRNFGDAPLTINFSNSRFANNFGIQLISPTSDVTIQPGDSVNFIVRFQVPSSGNLPSKIVDTLLIDLPEDGWNPPVWKVVVSIDILPYVFDILAFDLNTNIDTLDLGKDCLEIARDTSLVLRNRSNFALDLDFLYNSNNLLVDTSRFGMLSPSAFDSIVVSLLPRKGELFDSIIVFPKDCPALRKVVYVKFFGISPATEFHHNRKQIDTLHLGEICIGDELMEKFFVFNSGNFPIKVKNVEIFGNRDGLSFDLATNKNILVSDSLENEVRCNPVSEGEFFTKLVFTFDLCDYKDTLIVHYKAVRSNLVAISGFDFGIVPIGVTDTNTIVIVNRGSGAVYIEKNFLIALPFEFIGSKPNLPTYLMPNDTLKLFVAFTPNKDTTFSFSFDIIANALKGCPDTIRINLLGRGSKAKILVNVDSIFFGVFPYCKSKDTIIYVTNTGTTDLLIKSVNIQQAYVPEHFVLSNSFSTSRIPPNGTDSCAVTFRGVKGAPDGLKTAELVIESNDVQNPFIRIKLSAIQENLNVDLIPDTLDFGICQIGDSKIKTLVLVNKGKYPEPQRIRDFEGNKAVFEPVPSTAVLFPQDSARILFTFRPDRQGEIFDSMRIVYSQPCPDTQWVYLRGWGTEGSFKIPSKLDFGDILICSIDTLLLPVENLGTIPFRIDSVSISGADSKNFIVLDKFPVSVDSILYLKVVFLPDGIEKIYSATLRIYLFINNRTITYDVTLIGNRVRLVKFSPLEVDFGTVPIGFFRDTSVNIVNRNSDVVVSEIFPFSNPSVFLTNLSWNTFIPSDSFFTFTASFKPDKEGEIRDTFKIVIKYPECLDTILLFVRGYGFPQQSVLVDLPDISFDPKLGYGVYPVYAGLYGSKLTLKGVSFEGEIAFNWKLFHVQGVDKGRIISDLISNDFRKITVRIDSIELNDKLQKMFQFYGIPLLSDTDYTEVRLTSVKWSPNYITRTYVEPGSMTTIVCKEGGKRLVRPATLQLLGINSENGRISLDIETNVLGKHVLRMFDILGNQVFEFVFDNERESVNLVSISIPAENLPSGVYFIMVSNSIQSKIEKIIK